MIRLLEDTFDQKTYDEVAAHPMQLWAWGEARKKMGVDVYRIGEFKGSKLVNVYQLTRHPIPYTGKHVGYVPRSNFPSKELLDHLREIAHKGKLAFVKFEPNTKASSKLQVPSSMLKPSPYTLFPKWTMTLDLTPSEDELLKQMKPKTRYNVRLAQKKGVTVREMTSYEGFEIFIKLYFETTKRQKYFGHTKEYHQAIFEALKENNAAILVAFYEKTPLAAYELFYHKDTLYYPYGGSSEEMKNLMATNLLMWEAIRYGKQKGFKNFDMWGSLPPDYDQKNIWSGFTRFKEGYGSKFTEMVGTYDLVFNPLIYHLFNTAQRVRNIFLGV
ncbi:hypothetical protein A3G67_04540 [Candidatus Roizmanbacteria bacterium RIFCSPLOWO2_12_FULL_40_12]|uniref:BioF2-like acetyltransferase domain-containing protein n=1 Tax=Candidatus Roizmanbacteria bacterium RIFCSPLOWO2_01_FULL_40_42 TaxID=1802066 RepID=A0A1F7J4Q4_9BACT|nr:MAG: hypothetical protein A2779_04610 [Candidatus Roizmanbacteria bacterium RIFCSPHIGHO2_01_FULL_40_98]OGK27356.1 MAG: hypothetical protein A3C31_04935 [Candidatus Roizmanbacteria bacterium RIFCSPHIGHO2_02_FULL_40_53]OGK30772.1 MAG: hypothetical protein A2W49_02105 [Candidatus Roizmanbacteria bacterium RIFCSPHIGHO2_12_41_18]OGK36461.1 MAG: hypothetical protein A3E69_02560 [Candidatus Roizmanbacteria bacterium RIFCSPHIGHO2_12_FULL_40_130]OGK50589.1 MAG: hypothetical protein A3B50_02290 [Candi